MYARCLDVGKVLHKVILINIMKVKPLAISSSVRLLTKCRIEKELKSTGATTWSSMADRHGGGAIREIVLQNRQSETGSTKSGSSPALTVCLCS